MKSVVQDNKLALTTSHRYPNDAEQGKLFACGYILSTGIQDSNILHRGNYSMEIIISFPGSSNLFFAILKTSGSLMMRLA